MSEEPGIRLCPFLSKKVKKISLISLLSMRQDSLLRKLLVLFPSFLILTFSFELVPSSLDGQSCGSFWNKLVWRETIGER
jgi:hypothetical protein